MGKSSKNKKQSCNSGRSNNGGSDKIAWNFGNRPNHSRVQNNSNIIWNDSDEHFPALGAVSAPLPKVNVWEERKSKQEAVKALEPQNKYDEDAMLQQALALSMLEAAEEEKRRKEYFFQALEKFPEDLEYFNASEEFIAESTFESETNQPTKDYSKENLNSKNGVIPNFNQNVKTYSCSGAKPKINKVIERFGGWGLRDERVTSSSEKLSDFVDEVVNEKPLKKADKYNKVIAPKYQSDWKAVKENREDESLWLVSEEDKKPVISEPWEKDRVLYDGKGTFIDHEDGSSDIQKNTGQLPKSPNEVLDTWLNSDDDDGWGNDAVFKDKKENLTEIDVQNDKIDLNNVDNDLQNFEQFTDKLAPVSADVNVKSENLANKVSDASDFSLKGNECRKSSWPDHNQGAGDTLDFSLKSNENHKSFWPDHNQGEGDTSDMSLTSNEGYKSSWLNHKQGDSDTSNFSLKSNEGCKSSWPDHKQENELSSTYNFDVSEHSIPKKFSQTVEPVQISNLPSKDVWGDNPSNTSSYFTMFPDDHIESKTELDAGLKSAKFCRDIESEILNSISNEDDDIPPILPPKPVPLASELNKENETFINETLETNLEESPPILPPQPVSQPVPQPVPQPSFPGMNPFLYNPAAMFPGFNPLLTCGMDPVTVRQMLMLSNPFFASQLLAMEQCYRSMGMPVDLFSLSTSMPVASVPGMMGPTLEQNAFANTFSSTSPSDAQAQNQFENGSFVPNPQINSNNSDQKPFEVCTQPPNIATVTSLKNMSSVVQNDDGDSWYKSYLSSDSSAAIPPPKPPSLTCDNDNVLSVSEPLRPSQSACSLNQKSVPTNAYSSSVSNVGNGHKPLSAVEACMTKIETTGWSDDEDESSKIHKTKTTCGWDDDGWGNDSVPAKSFNSHSVSENKKKAVYRQPSRQPQFSRYQGNKTHN